MTRFVEFARNLLTNLVTTRQRQIGQIRDLLRVLEVKMPKSDHSTQRIIRRVELEVFRMPFSGVVYHENVVNLKRGNKKHDIQFLVTDSSEAGLIRVVISSLSKRSLRSK